MGAGGAIGEASDNPLGINITAMVDIIFCLCLFFMCSLHFKQLEGKMDAWLPTEKGNNIGEVRTRPNLEEIRLFLRWEPVAQKVIRKVGNRAPVHSDEELRGTLRAMVEDYRKLHQAEIPVLIDAMADVPWQDVVHSLDLLKEEKLTKIEFVEPLASDLRPASR
jgi:biopolymer transport protein ExbD